jgi:Zn-dependent protease with chaperone function
MRGDTSRIDGWRAGAEQGCWGYWRALIALPATIAGTGVMLVARGFMGRWEGLGLLAWVGAGLLIATRPGERGAARLAHGFRRLSPDERSVLDPLWGQVLDRCGVPRASVDLYVQRSAMVNAYAVGGRRVGLTSRVVSDYRAGRIDGELLAAIMCHELGHLADHGARIRPISWWLAMPWRLFLRLVVRLATRLAGAQPLGLLASVVIAGFTVAIAQAARLHVWSTVVILGALILFSVVTLIADAALSRAGERAADRFATRAGHGCDLARALHAFQTHPPRCRRLLDPALDSHPAPERRIEDLRQADGDRRQHSSVNAFVAAQVPARCPGHLRLSTDSSSLVGYSVAPKVGQRVLAIVILLKLALV